jgi:hypothetical protein
VYRCIYLFDPLLVHAVVAEGLVGRRMDESLARMSCLIAMVLVIYWGNTWIPAHSFGHRRTLWISLVLDEDLIVFNVITTTLAI